MVRVVQMYFKHGFGTLQPQFCLCAAHFTEKNGAVPTCQDNVVCGSCIIIRVAFSIYNSLANIIVDVIDFVRLFTVP